MLLFPQKKSLKVLPELKKSVPLHSLSEREVRNEIFDRLRTEEMKTSS